MPLETLKAHPQYARLVANLRLKIASGKMKARQLANILWACAKIGDAHVDGVVDDVLAAMMEAGTPFPRLCKDLQCEPSLAAQGSPQDGGGMDGASCRMLCVCAAPLGAEAAAVAVDRRSLSDPGSRGWQHSTVLHAQAAPRAASHSSVWGRDGPPGCARRWAWRRGRSRR